MQKDENTTPAFIPKDRHLLVPDRSAHDRVADSARAELDHIYTNNPPNQTKEMQAAAQQHTAAPMAAQQDTNPYHRTHQENFDWRNYHSAWQNYYQQYYQRYYWQQLHSERQKLAAGKAEDAAAPPDPKNQIITGADPAADQKAKVAQLKQDITDTVKAQATKARKSHHFVPIASAVGVGLLFLFLQFNSIMIAQVRAYVSPGNLSNESLIVDPTATANVGPEPKLIIPKINVDVPVDYSVKGLSEAQIQTSLRDGATHYNLPGANALPGQVGNTVILGHSSNDIFNQGAYKFVFVLLDRLRPGDTFYLNYEGKRYIYKVTETKVIDPTQVNELQRSSTKPTATLVTCTPPGTALKRLVIFADQISPDPGGSAQATTPQPTEETPQNATLPGNEPNWLDNIWNFFF
jgi:sortase A